MKEIIFFFPQQIFSGGGRTLISPEFRLQSFSQDVYSARNFREAIPKAIQVSLLLVKKLIAHSNNGQLHSKSQKLI